MLLCGITEDAEARADKDGEVERLLCLATQTFPILAVERIEEIRLIVAILDGCTKPDDALLGLDGLHLLGCLEVPSGITDLVLTPDELVGRPTPALP